MDASFGCLSYPDFPSYVWTHILDFGPTRFFRIRSKDVVADLLLRIFGLPRFSELGPRMFGFFLHFFKVLNVLIVFDVTIFRGSIL